MVVLNEVVELKMEHVLILLIAVFLLYHLMNRCSCNNGFSVGAQPGVKICWFCENRKCYEHKGTKPDGLCTDYASEDDCNENCPPICDNYQCPKDTIQRNNICNGSECTEAECCKQTCKSTKYQCPHDIEIDKGNYNYFHYEGQLKKNPENISCNGSCTWKNCCNLLARCNVKVPPGPGDPTGGVTQKYKSCNITENKVLGCVSNSECKGCRTCNQSINECEGDSRC